MDFAAEVQQRIAENGNNSVLKEAAQNFLRESVGPKYPYNFAWLGRPVIQYPQDIVAVQELIWEVKPDLVIETGIAHGGSLILSASMLALLDYCDAVAAGSTLDPRQSKRRVLGVDIDIRPHNRTAIEQHPLAHMIDMIQGSSIGTDVLAKVHESAKDFKRVLVFLDSNHTHDHVLRELDAYAGLASVGSYCVVFDTLIEDMPADAYPDRPWGPGDNPKTAVCEWLKSHSEFEIDMAIHNKLLITVAPDGFLKRRR